MSKTEKVVEIKSAKIREAELFAEALVKDWPSDEARTYIDEKLASGDPQWTKDGDLMAAALDEALKQRGYATIAAVKRKAELMRQELGAAEAMPAERMLIDHAVLCFLRLGLLEDDHAAHTRAGRFDVIESWDRRLTQAQHRFDRAMTTLARTRALLARAEQEKARRALRVA